MDGRTVELSELDLRHPATDEPVRPQVGLSTNLLHRFGDLNRIDIFPQRTQSSQSKISLYSVFSVFSVRSVSKKRAFYLYAFAPQMCLEGGWIVHWANAPKTSKTHRNPKGIFKILAVNASDVL